MPTGVKVVIILMVIPLTIFLLVFFGPKNFREDQNTIQQLEFRLQSAKKKTKDYEALKNEHDLLVRRIEFYNRVKTERHVWSRYLQNLALFTNERKVWFGSFRSREMTIHAKAPTPTQSYTKIILESFSATRDLNIPNDFRKEILATDWWKKDFQENGINEPAYEIHRLSEPVFVDDFYHKFTLELNLKPIIPPPVSSARPPQVPIKEDPSLPKITQLENAIRNEEAKQKDIDRFNSILLQLSREYSQFSTLFPDDKKLEEFFSAIRQISDELHIPPFGFKSKRERALKENTGANSGIFGVDIPIQFEASYEKIGQFLNRIENYPCLILIKDLEITSKNTLPPRASKSNDIKKPEENLLLLKMKLVIYLYQPVSVSSLNSISSGSVNLDTYEWIPKATRDPFLWILQIK